MKDVLERSWEIRIHKLAFIASVTQFIISNRRQTEIAGLLFLSEAPETKGKEMVEGQPREEIRRANRLGDQPPETLKKFGAASGFRTHDIRCHRAAFCH